MSFVENLIQDIQRALGNVSGFYSLRISYWGNDISEALLLNYDFHNYSDSFLENIESLRQPANIFLIVGSINTFQVHRLKKRFDTLSDRKFLVHIPGPVANEKLVKSYMSPIDMDKSLSVDLSYNHYPVDVEHLLSEILTLTKDGRG